MPGSEKTPWSVSQRLEFIEFRLFWEGAINRSDLTERFGISPQQASADLTQYQALAPERTSYDKSRKTYVAAEPFSPCVSEPSARQFLAQLRSIADGALRQDETWVGALPAFGVVPLVRRPLEAEKLRKVVRTIREASALQITYQSFSRPSPLRRWITPHALGFDGQRWHVRAWCHRNDDFRDFVLARVLSVGAQREHFVDPFSDVGWHTLVKVQIGPHPEMQEGHKRAIELEYGMEKGKLDIETRVCLSYYLERHLGLDLDPAALPPRRQQIVLLNRQDLERARERVAELDSGHRERQGSVEVE